VKIDDFISKDLRGMGAFETTQFIRGDVFVNLDFLMTTHIFTSDEELEVAFEYIKAVLRLIVKYFSLIPSMIRCFDEASVEPDLFLIDEEIAVALSYNEILFMLSDIFGKNYKALKFFIKNDRVPIFPDLNHVTRDF
jgi:hypothetical protein